MSTRSSSPVRRRGHSALVVLLVLALSVLSAGCVPTGVRGEEEQADDILFKGRPDRTDADLDRRFGDSMKIDAVEANVEKAEFVQEIGPNDKAGYIVATVSATNTDAAKVKVTRFDFAVITPDGDEKSHTLVEGGREGELPVEAELAKGETTTGTVAFNIGDVKGTYYVVYAPKEDNEIRGVWGPVEVA